MLIFIVITVIILTGLFCLYVYRESTQYHVVRYCIKDTGIDKDKITIVFMSDLHNRQYGEKNAQVLKDIENINPDYVCIGGDMITSCMEKWTDYSDTLDFIKNIAEKYRVLYGMGNHEERLRRVPDKFPEGAYEDLTNRLSNIGAGIIVDTHVSLDEGINIYGLDLEHEYFRKFVTRQIPDGHLSKKLGEPEQSKYNILLAHNPEHFKSYAKWGADLVLSGHVHGGIVRLPLLGGVVSPALKLFPKYDGGLFVEGKSTMILSRGLGSHTLPLRINNKAELIVVELLK